MGPDFLLAHDNVVVYLTFRVQIFGFLNLGFGDYTGNMALKDQQLGMKWVYDNIEFFSGNRNQIMLFGDSIGKFKMPLFKTISCRPFQSQNKKKICPAIWSTLKLAQNGLQSTYF